MGGLGQKRCFNMYNYVYVPKSEYMPVKKELMELFKAVQDDVRDYFTFRFDFIGSASRNMITRNYNGNEGYDFDVNFRVNDPDENYSAGQIKHILMHAFNRYNRSFDYDYCEDSKRVITFKVKDKRNSRILHSCDIAIVYDCGDDRQQYIHFNKTQGSYYWAYQPQEYYELGKKIGWIKENCLWHEVRERYLINKNNNQDPNKKSRSIFAETVSQVYNEN